MVLRSAARLLRMARSMRELSRCLGLGWERARACLPIPFPALKPLRNPSDPALAKRVKDAKNACKKAMDALAQKLSDPSQKLLADLKLTAPAMSALLELALLFDREYARDKRRASLVDYADLEHEAARILTDEDGRPSALARQVSLRYREIMVDEYQDVSQVQDEIFFAVSREGKNLFLVGDVKQSIYRFRLADPKIFTKKYDAWAESGAPGRRILLRENFRSHQEILDGANAVFARCMSRELGDVDYDENAALICGNGLSGAEKPELMLLDLPESDGEQAPDALALEAEMVAEKIRALMGSGLTLSGGRPLQYGDIAILLRTSSRSAGVFRRVLTRLGLPVAAGQGGGFYSSVEISAVMSMLAILDDPHQDIPLMAVLRSPAFDFSADELSAIRAEDPNSDYFSALRQRARHDTRCAAFLELLSGLRSVAPDLPTAELVWQVIERLDLLPLCSAMSEGSVRRTPPARRSPPRRMSSASHCFSCSVTTPSAFASSVAQRHSSTAYWRARSGIASGRPNTISNIRSSSRPSTWHICEKFAISPSYDGSRSLASRGSAQTSELRPDSFKVVKNWENTIPRETRSHVKGPATTRLPSRR